jgi:methyl acetate hydrolase
MNQNVRSGPMQFDHLDELLQHATQAREVAGIVAVATSDRETLYEGAFGLRDITNTAPMKVDTVFWIASMTKAITATAAMQLVETGKLDLDEPVGRLLPDLAAPKVLEGFGPDSSPKLRDASRPITLRHLLTHTAGMSYDMWNADTLRYMTDAGIPGVLACENRCLSVPLAAEPGERWEYGISIDFVGKAVEAASGTKLDVYLRENVLGPLGMKDTSFKLTADQRSRLATMHARQPDGSLQPIAFEVPQEPEFHMGGGGLYGTAPDYVRFLRMLLNRGTLDGNRVLRADTVATMSQNHIGDLNVTRMTTAIPEVSQDVDLYPEQEKKWGLSFLINTQRTAEGRSPGSLAWAGLANTYFWLDPAAAVGGVFLTQSLPFADPKPLTLFARFEKGVYAGLGDLTQAA